MSAHSYADTPRGVFYLESRRYVHRYFYKAQHSDASVLLRASLFLVFNLTNTISNKIKAPNIRFTVLVSMLALALLSYIILGYNVVASAATSP